MGALTPDKNAELLDQTNEGKNISLIKESTSGYAYYSNSKPVYNYNLQGVLINIPQDSEGFTVRGIILDEFGNVIKVSEEDLDYFTSYTKNSDPTTIAGIQTNEFVNVSKIQLVIMNPYGQVVFNETFDFNMDEFDSSGLDELPENDTEETDDSDSDSSSSNSFTDSDDDSSTSSSSSSGGTYVGSVNSDKFHYPSCSYAKRIKDSNKITFSSRDEAIASGYSPCSVCSP